MRTRALSAHGRVSSCRPRGGFTLIELLVVIAIIALLIGILLPAVAAAIKTARQLVSQANMRSLTQVQLLYTNDHDESFPNPFPTTSEEAQSVGLGANGPWFVLQFLAEDGYNEEWFWTMGGNPALFNGEMYAFYWYSVTARAYLSQSEYASEVQFGPSDVYAKQRFDDIMAANGSPFDLFVSWDTTYLYSPTFWQKPSRYRPTGNLPYFIRRTSSPDYGPNSYVGRNQMADVKTPSSKVILFERFDFTKNKRQEQNAIGISTPITTVKAPPQWNNPGAEPLVTTVDGSVSRSDNDGKIYREMLEDGENSFTVTSEIVPPDLWNLKRGEIAFLPDQYDIGDDPWENGESPHTSAVYNAIFWATRKGVAGRDLPR